MQAKVYSNGYVLEMPNREVVREPYTREELEQRYDRKIKSDAKFWGENHYYTNGSRNTKTRNLTDLDEGKVVEVYKEEWTKDGIDWGATYYSDGTKVTSCYGYWD